MKNKIKAVLTVNYLFFHEFEIINGGIGHFFMCQFVKAIWNYKK